MIDLRLLGRIELIAPAGGDAGAAVLRQPKRLALLAFVSLSGRGGFVRRDVVLATFWPELDVTRARAALRQALHFLRQHLGDDVVDTRGDDLAVTADHVRTDVSTFDEAIVAERWAEAAALYRGPLLEGFHPAGVGTAFEDWLVHERARLHDGARLALDELSRASEAEGDASGAAQWGRRAVELAPLHEATTRRLMRLLESSGDPAGALAAYEALARRLAEEQDAGPTSATSALAVACRQAAAREPRGGESPERANATTEPPAMSPAAPSHPNAATRGPGEPRRRPARATILVALILPFTVALSMGWWAGRGQGAVDGARPIRVVVLPFAEVGEGDEVLPLDGMTDAIAARLASLRQVEVVDPHSARQYRDDGRTAQAIGAELDVRYVLRGTVQWAPRTDGAPSASVTPVLVRTDDGVVRWTGAPYVVTARALFDVQAEIAADVAVALDVTLTGDERRLLSRPPNTHPAAYRDYVRGMEQLREWRTLVWQRHLLEGAIERFTLATRRDSTFALAFARLAEARLEEYRYPVDPRLPRDTLVLRHFHLALDRARRLDPDLPEAIAAHGRYLADVARDTAAAFEAFDRASALRPNDAELLINRVRFPRWKGSLERDAALLERALRLDPHSRRALQEMVLISGTMRRYADEDHFAARLIHAEPRGFVGYLHGAHAALNARGDTARARWLIAQGMQRSVAPNVLVQTFHMLGDDYARALDTLRLETLVRDRAPRSSDSSFFLAARFDAALRLGEPGRLRSTGAAYQRSIAGIASPQVRALHNSLLHAALDRPVEAEAEARLSGEHMAALRREMFAGGDTVEARRNDGAIAYNLARVYALTGNAPEMRVHLRRALTAPHGSTPYYVRLDPAFRRWLGRPELEQLLVDGAGAR